MGKQYVHKVIAFIKKQHPIHIALVALLLILPVVVALSQQRQNATSLAANIPLTIDAHVGRNQGSNSKNITSPVFNTNKDGELILVLLASDGPQTGEQAFTTVSGGGLSFQLAKRANTQKGVAEAWYAYAPTKLTNVTISAARAKGSYHGMIDVITFKGARNVIGATSAGGAPFGAAGLSLTTTAANSWIWGIGSDWDGAKARILGSTQTMSRQFVDKQVGDTFWSQYITTTTPTVGTTVRLNTTAPTNDSWNMVAVEILPAEQAATPIPTLPSVSSSSIWDASIIPANPSDTDNQAVEAGVKFKAAVDGVITGIRYYKSAENTGTHVGNLWTSSGQLLATAIFTNETLSGWQQVNFASPAAIQANTVYVASYHAPFGHYAGDNSFFATNGVTNGPLTALSNTEAGGNGVYKYGASGFPNQTFQASNYWVDVVFQTNSTPIVQTPTPVASIPTNTGIPPNVTQPPLPSNIIHGEQLTEAMVGPWSLQGVPKGQEQLQVVPLPARGYWRLDTPDEFVPAGTYVYNNNVTNHGGTLAVDTMIDGYLVPAGTKVVQFRDLSASDFYAQGVGGTFLFRGVRVRNNTVGGASIFNDYNASYTNYIHYSDLGGLGPQDGQEMLVAWKMLGGKDHRVLRTYISNISTGLQPNVPGVEITENYIDKINFYYGEQGPCGTGGSCTYHLNGISSEGMSNVTPTRFKILRNHITVPSPDGAGRITPQTDTIALFGSNGGSYNDVLVDSNYLGGSGYVIYAAGERPGAKNVRFTNNKITTRWWTNGGNFGPVTAQASWGSDGNIATGNVWADDYGTGGNGNTVPSQRQYPNGDGPRKGQIIFGN